MGRCVRGSLFHKKREGRRHGLFLNVAKLSEFVQDDIAVGEAVIINLVDLLISQMGKEGYNDALGAEALELLTRVHELKSANKKYYTYTLVLTRLQRG